MRNLITLCRSCHSEWEQRSLAPPDDIEEDVVRDYVRMIRERVEEQRESE